MSDLIKRSDAIKVLKDSVVEMGSDDFCEMGVHIDDIEAVVNAIPSADRPQGEWIVNISDYKSICSVCGANETDFIYGTEMWYGLGESKFCPNCGARMKGATDEVR